jgi:hypothetical protein
MPNNGFSSFVNFPAIPQVLTELFMSRVLAGLSALIRSYAGSPNTGRKYGAYVRRLE